MEQYRKSLVADDYTVSRQGISETRPKKQVYNRCGWLRATKDNDFASQSQAKSLVNLDYRNQTGRTEDEEQVGKED